MTMTGAGSARERANRSPSGVAHSHAKMNATVHARDRAGLDRTQSREHHDERPGTASTEWCVRQRTPGGYAIAWVRADDAADAAAIANRRLGRRGGWRTGPDAELEVFPPH